MNSRCEIRAPVTNGGERIKLSKGCSSPYPAENFPDCGGNSHRLKLLVGSVGLDRSMVDAIANLTLVCLCDYQHGGSLDDVKLSMPNA